MPIAPVCCQLNAGKIGCSVDMLMEWVKRVDIEAGHTANVLSEVAERLKTLERRDH